MLRTQLYAPDTAANVLPLTFPRYRDLALPVRQLGGALAFYRNVFDMQQVDASQDPPYALVRRDQFQIALYEVPGYVAKGHDFPVLSVALNANEFDALRARIRLHGGTVVRDVVAGEPIPRFLFTDPDGCNLLECRAQTSLKAI